MMLVMAMAMKSQNYKTTKALQQVIHDYRNTWIWHKCILYCNSLLCVCVCVFVGAPDEEDDESLVLNPEGRGKRPVFECFWNGRLIPYTTVSE